VPAGFDIVGGAEGAVMRTLTYLVAVSADGLIAGPDRADPTGFWPIGEDYVEHLVAHYPETLPGAARTALGVTAAGTRFDTVVSGRRTYEIGLAAGVTNAYPHLRHVVFSRTLGLSSDPTVEVIDSDPVEAVRAMKLEAGKDIWLVGGGDLAGTLYAEIDSIVLKLSPLTLGSGIGLFGSSASFDVRRWRLVDHVVLASGVGFLTYEAESAS
jgi:dihydrofolate reductase